MTEGFYQELKDELQKSLVQKKHPFRYFTLATSGPENIPRLRTVVLRKVSENLMLTFYTDKRSTKIAHIEKNNKVSLLFYHPKKLLQLQIEGVATIVDDKAKLKDSWNGIQLNSRKDYTTDRAPGSTIDNPDNISYLEGENYFCMVEINPLKIEYLKLKRPNHLRIQFSKSNDDWQGEFLVP